MDQYDPLIEPDPEEWLALDEQERIQLVEDYHRRARVRLPHRGRTMHAIMHAAVENQIAADDPSLVRPTIARLMAEGLDRHDAVHAVAAIMLVQTQTIVRDETAFSTERYLSGLASLTAESWRRSG